MSQPTRPTQPTSASPQPATRRIRVHRRRTPLRILRRYLQRLSLTLYLLFLILSHFHPRTVTKSTIATILTNPPPPPPHTLYLTPAAHLLRYTLLYTPVETIAFLTLPSLPFTIPASTSSRTFYLPPSQKHSHLSLTILRHGHPHQNASNTLSHISSFHLPPFTPLQIHPDPHRSPNYTTSTVNLLEYADGLVLFASVHSAFLATCATADPSLPPRAFLTEIFNLYMYYLAPIHNRLVAKARAIDHALFASLRHGIAQRVLTSRRRAGRHAHVRTAHTQQACLS